jgi:hypothetical protein
MKTRLLKWRAVMTVTIAECAENARQCEWYASKTKNAEERQFLLRMAKHWKKLAAEKEREVLTAARSVA